MLPALLSLPCHRLQEKKQKEREARSGFRVEQTFNLEDFILPWASGELARPSGPTGVAGTLAKVPGGLYNTGFLSTCPAPGDFVEKLNALLLPINCRRRGMRRPTATVVRGCIGCNSWGHPRLSISLCSPVSLSCTSFHSSVTILSLAALSGHSTVLQHL